ncbi:MAG: hypothetical protein AAF799_47965 [Myxococcota bacterium]
MLQLSHPRSVLTIGLALSLGCTTDEASTPTPSAETEGVGESGTTAVDDGTADETAAIDTEAGETDGALPPPTGLFTFSLRIPGRKVLAIAVFADALDEEVSLELDAGLEIPNNGIAVGPDGDGGVVYTSDGATPRLTEFLVDADGGIEQGRTVSFEGSIASANGVAAGNFVFVSPTKAYVVDTIEFNTVVFDPSEMLITGNFELGDVAESGFFGIIGTRPVLRDGEVVISLSYLSLGVGFSPLSRLVFIDPDTDQVTQILEVPDCSALTELHLADNGDLYAASDVANVTNRLDGRGGGRECIVRIPSGEYDVAEEFTYTELSGGWDGAGLIPLSDTTVFVRVIDPSLVPADLQTPAAQLDAWYWAKLDLADPTTIEIFDDREPRGPSTQHLELGGRRYATEISGDFSESRLVDFGTGEPTVGLSAPGVIVNAFRVRM